MFDLLLLVFLTTLFRLDALGIGARKCSINFFALGDWGKGGVYGDIRSRTDDDDDEEFYGDDEEKRREWEEKSREKKDKYTYQAMHAQSMGIYGAQSSQPDFIIALGDNFYDDGVYSTTDSKWQTHFEDVYLAYESLKRPWHAVVGNHDYGYGDAGILAQINKTEEDMYWNMPHDYYAKEFDIPCGGGTLLVLFVNSCTLAPKVTEATQVDDSLQETRIQEQQDYFIDVLENSHADWKIAVGHYPLRSAGEHGDTNALLQNLLPILKKYDVHAYFNGHDHISEHLHCDKPTDDTFTDNVDDYSSCSENLEYFNVGSSAILDELGDENDLTKANLIYYLENQPSFVSVKVSRAELKVDFIDTDPKVVYSYILNNEHALEIINIHDPVVQLVSVAGVGLFCSMLLVGYSIKGISKKSRTHQQNADFVDIEQAIISREEHSRVSAISGALLSLQNDEDKKLITKKTKKNSKFDEYGKKTPDKTVKEGWLDNIYQSSVSKNKKSPKKKVRYNLLGGNAKPPSKLMNVNKKSNNNKRNSIGDVKESKSWFFARRFLLAKGPLRNTTTMTSIDSLHSCKPITPDIVDDPRISEILTHLASSRADGVQHKLRREACEKIRYESDLSTQDTIGTPDIFSRTPTMTSTSVVEIVTVPSVTPIVNINDATKDPAFASAAEKSHSKDPLPVLNVSRKHSKSKLAEIRVNNDHLKKKSKY